MSTHITIAGRKVGPGEPAFIVAELSANHHGNYAEAAELVSAAAAAGADAVKLQTYTADTLTLDSDRPCFRIGAGTQWAGRTLHDLYAEAYTPWEWQPRLKALADELGIVLFASPFDHSAVEFLAAMDVPAYKIASFELIDTPLVEAAARQGRPMIVSTGMASFDEIAECAAAVRRTGNNQLALLKCTSAYPAPAEEMNLRTIPYLRERFDAVVGLSDHTLSHDATVAAVALGASIVEKHLTLSRAAGGPDASFSLEPEELRSLVDCVRRTERALGRVTDTCGQREQACLPFRRSLFAVADIRAGEPFTPLNVRSIRPADGLPPGVWTHVIGRHAARNIGRGEPLAWDMVAGHSAAAMPTSAID